MSAPVAVLARTGLVGLGVGRYLLGWLAIAIVVLAVAAAAVRLRAWLVPWRGAPARMVEATVGIGLVTAVAFVLGAVGAFAGWPVFIALVLVSLIVERTAARLVPRTFVMEDEPTRRSGIVERVAAVGALTVVGAQWISHTAGALGHGMTEGDTLWYHGVFAARFVQEGRLDIFPDLGNAAEAFFPANSQMYHALAFFPFDRDMLSLPFNLVLAPLALLAAYCIGRRRGLGALCVTACAVALGFPGIVGVHPGQATNDVMCATFLLVAIALLVEGGIEPVPLALAGVASALSLGTKLTVSVPLTVLTVCIVAVAIKRRRAVLVAAWLVPLGVFGAFWFVRNWALVDNPLPFYDLHLGPLHFPDRAHLSDNASIADHLFERDVWSRVFRPGLRQAYGRAWLLVCATPGIAGLLAIGRGRRPAERIVGLVAVAAGIGYVFMPFTMELGGAAFAATARYAIPAVLVGMVLLPLAIWLDRAPSAVRVIAALAMLVVLVLDVAGPNVERFAPWWMPDRPLAIGLALVILVLGIVVWAGGRAGWLIVAPVLVLVVVGGGFFVQRHYLEHRYVVGAGLRLDRAYQYVNSHEPETVVPFQTIQFSPFFGPSFANRVEVFTPPRSKRSSDLAVRCHEWERAFRARRVTLLVVGPDAVFSERPLESWIRDSPSLQPVVRTPKTVVYRVHAPLRLACPTA